MLRGLLLEVEFTRNFYSVADHIEKDRLNQSNRTPKSRVPIRLVEEIRGYLAIDYKSTQRGPGACFLPYVLRDSVGIVAFSDIGTISINCSSGNT